MIYFEVRSSNEQNGEYEAARFGSRENAEKAAERKSLGGFFAQVWRVEISPLGQLSRYLCEYAASEAA